MIHTIISFSDKYDPGYSNLKLSLRTALSAMIGLSLFWFFSNRIFGVWAAFASYFLSQIDPTEVASIFERIKFIFLTSCAFVILTFLAYMVHSNVFAFSVTMGILAFLAAFTMLIDPYVFRAAIWGLCVYLFSAVAANSNIAPLLLALFYFSGSVIAISLVIASDFFWAGNRLQSAFRYTLTKYQLWFSSLCKEEYKNAELYKNQVKNALKLQQFRVKEYYPHQSFVKVEKLNLMRSLEQMLRSLYPLLLLEENKIIPLMGNQHELVRTFFSLLPTLLLKLDFISMRLSHNLPDKISDDNYIINFQKKVESHRQHLPKKTNVSEYQLLKQISDAFFILKLLDQAINKIERSIKKLREIPK